MQIGSALDLASSMYGFGRRLNLYSLFPTSLNHTGIWCMMPCCTGSKGMMLRSGIWGGPQNMDRRGWYRIAGRKDWHNIFCLWGSQQIDLVGHFDMDREGCLESISCSLINVVIFIRVCWLKYIVDVFVVRLVRILCCLYIRTFYSLQSCMYWFICI